MAITRDGCQWVEDGDGEYWEAGCGNLFTIIAGTPSENDMRYCCYCGKPLVEIPHEPENEE